jgi:hypothetical protein
MLMDVKFKAYPTKQKEVLSQWTGCAHFILLFLASLAPSFEAILHKIVLKKKEQNLHKNCKNCNGLDFVDRVLF